MTPAAEFSPEALLAHAGWMRALALGLVRDPNEADDVAQDAALAALLHPPPAGAALRPWLGQVVRHFAWRRARSERRRADREAEAREPAGPGDAGDTLARLDLQRALLEAVRSLEEPVRTTLVQRYFEGRSAADIAAAGGVPASTVRARLARGLELLRGRLDREAGSRGAWMALLVPLVPRELLPAGTAAGSGAVTASTSTVGALTVTLTKIALVTSAVVVSGLAWWNLSPERSAPAALPVSEPAVATLQTPDTAVAEPVAVPERSAASSAASASEPATPAAAEPAVETARTGHVDARLVDGRGTPWSGGELAVYPTRGEAREPAGSAAAGADGRVALELGFDAWALREPSAKSNFNAVARRQGCASRLIEVVVHEDRTTHLGDVVLLEAGVARGRVLDGDGRALAEARVGAIPLERFETLDAADLAKLPRVGSDLFEPLLTTATRADGSFELADVEPGEVVLWAHAPDHRYAVSAPLTLAAREAADGLTLVLPALERSDRIAGQVVGPDGKGRPASLKRDARRPDARRLDFLSTDAQGFFEFVVEHPDTVYELTATDGLREFSSALVVDVRPGDLEVRIAFRQGRTILVRTLDPEGAPVDDIELWISDNASAGSVDEQRVAPGEFEVECPTSGRFQIEAEAVGYRQVRSPHYEEATVPEVVELVLQRAPRTFGVVLADGHPVAGANVTGHRYDETGTMTVNALRCTVSPFEVGEATTDAEGRFELAIDADGPIVVRASADGWVDAESMPFDPTLRAPDDALELVLGPGGTIHGRVTVLDGSSAGGIVVGVHRGDGLARSMRSAPDGTYRFEDLMPGDWQVRVLEAELPAHGGSYASYSGSEPMRWDCRVEHGGETRFDLELESR